MCFVYCKTATGAILEKEFSVEYRNMPSISTLEAICDGFGITLSQFFCESEMVELSPELKELFDNWVNLTAEQKQAALQIMRAFNSEKK